MDYTPLLLSVKVAFMATLITFVLGLIAAWAVARMKYGKTIVDCIISLPLVLPPTVVGFYLLLLFGRNSWFGQWLLDSGIQIVFDIKGAIVASVVVSFPLMYRTARGAFEQVNENLLNVARTLGKSEVWIFLRVVIPLSVPGIIAGTVLAFTRALGEFGATIMLAGNIPGKTQTISVAIYSAVASGNRELAYEWTLVVMAISFASLLLSNVVTRYGSRKEGV